MSGGHYDYKQYEIDNLCSQVADDLEIGYKGVITQDRILANLVRDVGKLLYDTIHDVDYHFSGDREIKDIVAYRKEAIVKLNKILSVAESRQTIESFEAIK
jgi:hypothetical protein